jgi:hypothetical protein
LTSDKLSLLGGEQAEAVSVQTVTHTIVVEV